MREKTQGDQPDVPQTLEGYYTLHDVYAFDYAGWRELDDDTRSSIVAGAVAWMTELRAKGDTAAFRMIGQKGDLMFIHYRESPDELYLAESTLKQLRLFDYLAPTYSYFSVIELGLYELTAIAHRRLADQGLAPGSPEFEAAFEKEMADQKERAKDRLFCRIPEHKYVCFYPMSKRRGEQVNWYSLSMDERRKMMRGHGRIGHKYHEVVKQIIGGSVGLDDWEWGVTLHADDMVVFKKLIYEMRFDPASALFAEFGPFYLGIRTPVEELAGSLMP